MKDHLFLNVPVENKSKKKIILALVAKLIRAQWKVNNTMKIGFSQCCFSTKMKDNE